MNSVKYWLHHPKVSDELKEQIKAMSNEELAYAFDDKPLAFGTAGIRQKMGPGFQYLNDFTYAQMAFGYGRFLIDKFGYSPRCVIAHDNRKNGVHFTKIITDVLTSMGIQVYLFDNNKITSTPLLSYAIPRCNADGGINVTASHNPKTDNGFKAYNEKGAQLLKEDGQKVIDFMPQSYEILNLEYEPNDRLVKFISDEVYDAYFADVYQNLYKTDQKEVKDFKVIFSAQHGASSYWLPEMLRRFNYNVIPVKEQCKYDENFSFTKSPNPEARESWDLALQYADHYNADIMLATDPDADRLAVAVRHNNEFRYLNGNEMGIIFCYYILKHKKLNKTPYVVSSYVSTNLIDRIIKKYNGVVYRVGTGFKWIGNKINDHKDQEDFIVGFEEAIGSLTSTITLDKDSFQAAALALEIHNECLKRKITMVDFLEREIYPQFGFIHNETITNKISGLDWKQKAVNYMKLLGNYKDQTINNRKIIEIKWNENGDCLDWILENDSWIRFRLSGTEPKFKFYYNFYGSSLKNLKLEAEAITKTLKRFIGLL
ncbi:phospho-sugar mutase [Mycoplasma bradburyae]|uniref:Phospho-sugar mutase n=1 Tax=Mycoplasma bradburyae TaxID=2963128 RepID=A0AAW6HRW0_9MOLU|nr:phospho-sugar mutase [Mycoplasma bradburyae]MDC4163565.1 phospho-sugar mutase [Mycoplasma bradburyae]MDC4182163.1 phospho-sugar mutase [Mycoplasma bradburyae]MDC4183611.1 phospho-sugar mutase [Mycoplasma bradburyae]MDC4184349.1 phospho-sugar mutase [Mycoplasma bradburyae]UTS70268.1 phospho-sugar mutase [Mycoplasma bradburyae]